MIKRNVFERREYYLRRKEKEKLRREFRAMMERIDYLIRMESELDEEMQENN